MIRFALPIIPLVLLVVLDAQGQQTAKDNAEDKVKSPALPAGWTNLDIKGDQRKAINKVLDAYNAKIKNAKNTNAAQIEKLQADIDRLKEKSKKAAEDLRNEQYREAFKLLTEKQKTDLKTRLLQKADPGAGDTKKGDDVKKDDKK